MPWPFIVMLGIVALIGVAIGAGYVMWRYEERAARRREARREARRAEWLDERRVGL